MRTFLVLSCGAAITVAALVTFGLFYKSNTCIGCGRASTFWQLNADSHCSQCRKVYAEQGLPDGYEYDKDTNRYVPTWLTK